MRLGQIVQTPVSGLTVGVSQAGHLLGASRHRAAALAALRLRRRRHHLRDHVAGAHHDHLVAVAHVLAAQVLLVVERGELDRHARHLHGLELRERHHVAGAPDVPGHALERGGGGGGGELPGDRAARLAAHHAELALQVEVVDLDHHAVDLEVEPVAALLPGAAGAHHLVDGVVQLHVAVHAEAVLAQPLERLVVGLEREPLRGAHAVAPHRQRPRGRELRVELADRAGGRVARVGEGGLARLGALLVELGERCQRQVDLAAHLDQRRRVVDAQRYGADRAQVLGHVLAHLAVAARGPAHEHAVLVDQRDRQAVDLGLGHEAHVAHRHVLAGQVALAAQHPGGQLLLVARVGQRQHRRQVRHLGELVERLGAHALGGRVGRHELGVLGLEVAQLVQQRVVDVVAHLGVVEDVVAVVVMVELAPQLGGPLLVAGAHTSRAAGCSSPSRSKPASCSTPAWSVRSKCSGVTAMAPSAIAAKSVPSSWW